MRGVILQPGYLPWLGFFNQMAVSDVFVFFDDVQFDKRGWRNRNRIKTPNGPAWLTVPIVQKGKFDQLLSETMVDNTQKWAKKHLRSIQFSYRKAPYYDEVYPELERVINTGFSSLVDLDIELISIQNKWLELDKVKTVRSSQLPIKDMDKTGRLVEICQQVGITEYVSGPLCRNYLDLDMFAEAGITVLLQNYEHPEYKQLHGEFAPYMATIDLFMNCLPESLRILKQENCLIDFKEYPSGD